MSSPHPVKIAFVRIAFIPANTPTLPVKLCGEYSEVWFSDSVRTPSKTGRVFTYQKQRFKLRLEEPCRPIVKKRTVGKRFQCQNQAHIVCLSLAEMGT